MKITTQKALWHAIGPYVFFRCNIQAEGKTLHSEIHKLIISIWNKEELPQ